MNEDVIFSAFADPKLVKKGHIEFSPAQVNKNFFTCDGSSDRIFKTVGHKTVSITNLKTYISSSMKEFLETQFFIINTSEKNGEKRSDWEYLEEALEKPSDSAGNILKQLSNEYRLRYPKDLERPLQYIANIFNAGLGSRYGGIPKPKAIRYAALLENLCTSANEMEIYRLCDVGEKGRSSTLNKIKLSEFLSLEFALGEGYNQPCSISEFVARFQFFKSFINFINCFENIEQIEQEEITTCKKINEGLLHSTPVVTTEEISPIISYANKLWKSYIEEVSTLCNDIKGNVSESKLERFFLDHKEAPKDALMGEFRNTFGFPLVATSGQKNIQNYTQFKTLQDAIIHVFKHQNSASRFTKISFNPMLTFNEGTQTYAKATTEAYKSMLSEVIHGDNLESWSPGQFGGIRFKFKKGRYIAITLVSPQGFNFILTCF